MTKTIRGIVIAVSEMVAGFVDIEDLTGAVDYVGIFAQSTDEFAKLSEEYKSNGLVVDIQSTGDYYQFKDPIETSAGLVRRSRVRLPDADHGERGYADFEVRDYKAFKEKYSGRSSFKIVQNVNGVEMIELRVPGHRVRAYFPSVKF
ncbi:MAG: hypothetical protein V1856_01035 [Candidatus Liptonbacteria bacterium]